jgi:hypothetical protein
MNDSNDKRHRRKNWEYIVIVRYLHYPCSGIVLFDSRLEIICKCAMQTLQQPQKPYKKKYNLYSNKGENRII